MGPAGLFTSYMLLKYGYKVIIIERGEKVEDRVKTVEKLFSTGILNTESNVQFGEGGAGTLSDGKLNTLIKAIIFDTMIAAKYMARLGKYTVIKKLFII